MSIFGFVDLKECLRQIAFRSSESLLPENVILDSLAAGIKESLRPRLHRTNIFRVQR